MSATRDLRQLILVTCAIVSCLASSPTAEARDRDVQDLMYLAKSGPVFLRLHIQVDGKSYLVNWNKYVDELFEELDRDSDGFLTGDETKKIPTYQQLARVGFAMLRDPIQAASVKADSNPADNKVAKTELDKYLRGIGAGPFSARTPPANPNVRVNMFGRNNSSNPGTALFASIDQDGDKKLSNNELNAAIGSVQKLDIDDDETISRNELQSSRNPYAAYTLYKGQRATYAKPSVFIDLSTIGPQSKLVKQLLDLYDKPNTSDAQVNGSGQKDFRLSPEELGMTIDAFVEYDGDGNGQLDSKEVRQMLSDPMPHLELIVRIGRRGRSGRVMQQSIEVKSETATNGDSFAIRKSANGTPSLVLGDVQIEIGVDPNAYSPNYKPFYKQQFKNADANKNGYIERTEAQRSFYLRQSFDALDKDGDGKLFEVEVLAFVDDQQASANGRTVMNVNDQGRNLFEILDVNRDGRLSHRELAASKVASTSWDTNNDRTIANTEVPKFLRVTIGRVRPSFPGVNRTIRANMSVRFNPQGTRRGPVWFQKMDRNRDGDVSPREFLGKAEEFERLDKDANGLLDPQEATAAAS